MATVCIWFLTSELTTIKTKNKGMFSNKITKNNIGIYIFAAKIK